MLMGLASLATIATQAPPNLCLVVLDNERHGETGMQPSHTAHRTDLAAAAAACGFSHARTVTDEAGLRAALPLVHEAPGPVFLTVKVQAEPLPRVLPPRDGAYLKDRFRAALLGKDAGRSNGTVMVETERHRAKSRSGAGTTTPGFRNKNNQVVLRGTNLPGNDYNQRIYVLECGKCHHQYGANGSDIWLRKCPRCSDGRPGLDFE